MCNFPHRCMWQDWIVLYSLSHHLSAFLTLAVLISNIPSGWNSFFVWIFITRFEFFHYRCILSCFRYTKDSNSFLKQSSYCFSVDLERSVVEAVFNRKIDVKMLRLMFSFFGQDFFIYSWMYHRYAAIYWLPLHNICEIRWLTLFLAFLFWSNYLEIEVRWVCLFVCWFLGFWLASEAF